MGTKITVLIADDHPIFRDGLRSAIERSEDVSVIAEAADGESVLVKIQAKPPDVAVLDIDMPAKDGFEVATAIHDLDLPTKVVFLTGHKNEALFKKAFDIGVNGYVLKDSAGAEILDCIKTVNSGKSYVSPQLSSYLLDRSARTDALAEDTPGLSDLSPTEMRVLKMIAEEKSSREIGEQLFTSVRTIEFHRSNICEKLGLHGSNALLRFAIAHKSELSQTRIRPAKTRGKNR